MVATQKLKGFYVAKNLIYITIGSCLLVVLLVGLLCGLLARKKCTDEPNTITSTTSNSNFRAYLI